MISKIFYTGLFIFSFVALAVLLRAGALSPAQAGFNTQDLAGSWTCWDLGAADPCQRTLRGVDALSADYAWAVGEDGLAIRWDGQGWRETETPTNALLTDVSIVSETEVWAVGGERDDSTFHYQLVLFRWDGDAWQSMPITPTSVVLPIWSIEILPSGEGMLAGWNGAFWYDGQEWEQIYLGAVYGLSLLSANDGWLVGPQGKLLHWDGHELTGHDHPWPHPSPPPDMYDVDMAAADDVWAVGASSQLWHWDGQEWVAVSAPPFAGSHLVRAVSMVSSDDGWALTRFAHTGSGFLWRWDGQEWRSRAALDGEGWGLKLSGSDNGWVVGQHGQALQWDGDWWGERPTSFGQAIDGVAADDVWIGGPAANFWHWNGQQWSAVDNPAMTSIRDLQMLAANDGWAVGEAGAILRWNGAIWNPVDSPTTATLTALSMLNGAFGWAVSGDGEILRWDGQEWSLEDSPVSGYMFDVHAVSQTDAWIAGQSFLLRWNGDEWLPADAPGSFNAFYLSILMLGDDDGWLASNDTLWRWDGETWAEEHDNPTPFNLSSLAALSAGDGWAVGGDGLIMRWDGSQWRLFATPTTLRLTDMVMVSETDGWIVGPEALLRWDGEAWTAQMPPSPLPFNVAYWGLEALSPTAVWAVGQTAGWRSLISHWDGRRWTRQFAPSSFQLNSISMLSPDVGWAVGVSTALRWDGSLWQPVEIPAGAFALQAVDVTAADDVWVVGQRTGGFIWHWDGQEWHDMTPESTPGLFGLSMLSDVEGWAVGLNDAILYWDGEEWTSVTPPVSGSFQAVQALASDDVWILGSNGDPLILHWDGEDWHVESLPETPPLESLHFSAPDNGWAVGREGALLHWNGEMWQPVTSPSGSHYRAVIAVSGSDAWAVGEGPIVRYQEPPSFDFHVYLPAVLRE